jgi:phosphoesterase, MJ0936 family
MKIIIVSDIHGSSIYAKKLEEIVKKERPDTLILLGDFLYHGPGNNLPDEYDTGVVYNILNGMKDIIVAVRGNCDSEVDQIVLDFSMRDDYKLMEVNGVKWLLTHGHIKEGLPAIGDNDILFNGHTHRYELSRNYINPGSIALPRQSSENTYIIYENKVFTLYNVDGNIIKKLEI